MFACTTSLFSKLYQNVTDLDSCKNPTTSVFIQLESLLSSKVKIGKKINKCIGKLLGQFMCLGFIIHAAAKMLDYMVLASRVSGCLFGHPKIFVRNFLKCFSQAYN